MKKLKRTKLIYSSTNLSSVVRFLLPWIDKLTYACDSFVVVVESLYPDNSGLFGKEYEIVI
jgi:hypothetical protein